MSAPRDEGFVVLRFFVFLTAVLYVSCSPLADPADLLMQCLQDYFPESYPFSGVVYLQNSSSFQSVAQSYARNSRFLSSSILNPSAVIVAKNDAHVKGTVICSKKVSLEIRIRSGGHDYEGLSYVSKVPYVILDLYDLRSISLNLKDKTAWIDTGATTGELYYAIANATKTYAFPAGVCTMLGAGGHFSGGGYGNLMRKYGLSVDNIIDAKIVNVNGEILDRKLMGEDLFWAIRGGGGASFGVILSWKIKLVPVPERVTGFSFSRTLEQGATDLVVKWQQVADTIDDDLFIRLQITAANGTQPGKKTVSANFVALFLGQTPRLLSVMNESFPELGLREKDCIEMSWVESLLFYFGVPKNTSIDFLLQRGLDKKFFFKRKSDFVRESIPKEGLEAVWEKVIEAGSVMMQWNPYGGMMARINESATPFPHRAGIKFKVQYIVNWFAENATKANLDQTDAVYDAMTPYVSKSPREAFLNYRDLDIGINRDGKFCEAEVYGLKYFKGNFDRLVRVKTAVDPENFFKNEQSIPTLSKNY
ncbi:berberine bridge enzyme-like 14 [Punica granatum]|uniref:FAD-binding PCMH-type domain-containing protein n=2 Tax=Punica granatum TaxID=22663 RepID=A0A218VT72_PUNGR|nr:berberine bridge enzyme-like 14 [Punica granatum]OWM63764.1 hypothetical protein CDL15_Pgr006026 [Punica granatum]PKI57991.1 hypothetical protein CRG98_021622 [Punica granatum]